MELKLFVEFLLQIYNKYLIPQYNNVIFLEIPIFRYFPLSEKYSLLVIPAIWLFIVFFVLLQSENLECFFKR